MTATSMMSRVTAYSMGLLDLPPISEMDEIERRAKQGSTKALEQVLATCTSLAQTRVRRFMERDGLSLRDAMEKAGVAIVCIR